MKQVLFIVCLMLVGCGELKKIKIKDVELCINGDESICQTLPETPLDKEIKDEPIEEYMWSPSMAGSKDIGYSNMLYVNKFNLFLFKFEASNIVNKRLETVFKSSNHRNIPNVGKTYARAYFKDGFKVRIELINSNTNIVRSVKKYDWILHDNWNLTINNNSLSTVLKTEEQALEGVKLWSHDIYVKNGQYCTYFLWISTCTAIYRAKPVYNKYYYE